MLLDPEGCTSSKLPARLDVKKIDSQEHSVVMCMWQCKLVYLLSFNLCYHTLLFSFYATCFVFCYHIYYYAICKRVGVGLNKPRSLFCLKKKDDLALVLKKGQPSACVSSVSIFQLLCCTPSRIRCFAPKDSFSYHTSVQDSLGFSKPF